MKQTNWQGNIRNLIKTEDIQEKHWTNCLKDWTLKALYTGVI